MARLRVYHCVLNRATRQYGSHPTSDLLGVDYFYEVPADTEFPWRPGSLELFIRFSADGGVRGRVRVTVTRLHPDGTSRERVFDKTVGLDTVAAGRTILDIGFKLNNLFVPGEGTYAVRVSRRTRPRWDGRTAWRILGQDYFQVRRVP